MGQLALLILSFLGSKFAPMLAKKFLPAALLASKYGKYIPEAAEIAGFASPMLAGGLMEERQATQAPQNDIASLLRAMQAQKQAESRVAEDDETQQLLQQLGVNFGSTMRPGGVV